MKRLVIDPGVLVSAFISPRRSAPAIILEAVLDRRVGIISCPALHAEITDVLSRGKLTRLARPTSSISSSFSRRRAAASRLPSAQSLLTLRKRFDNGNAARRRGAPVAGHSILQRRPSMRNSPVTSSCTRCQ